MNCLARYYRFAIFTALGVLAFVLNISASRDWTPYLKQFSRLQDKSWSQVWADFSIFHEPLFYLNAKLWGEWIGFALFILILTVVLLNIKLHFLQKLTNSSWLAVYIYLCLYLFLFEGTVLRVAYATALIIPALYFLSRQQWWISLVLWVLATQIHLSTTIFLLAVPFFLMPYVGFRWLFLLFIVSPLCIVFQLSVFEYLAKIVGLFRADYASYGRDAIVANQNSSGMFFYYIAFNYLLTLGSITLLSSQLREDALLRMIASLCMSAVIIMCSIYDHVLVAARLGELLLVISPLLVAQAICQWPYMGKRFVVASAIIGFAVLGFARFIYLYPDLVRL